MTGQATDPNSSDSGVALDIVKSLGWRVARARVISPRIGAPLETPA